MGDGATLQLTANLSEGQIAGAPDTATGSRIWGNAAGDIMPPLSVRWHLGAR